MSTTAKRGSPTITLKVEHTQLEPGDDPPVFTFPQQTKVGDAATQAAGELGFSPDGTYTFSHEGKTLERIRTLVSFGLQDGDVVILTDFGRAV